MASDHERVPLHHRMLRSYARHDYEALPAALRLRGDEHVLDAGGGVGVLAKLLLERHPRLGVSVLERPEVAALVPPRDRLQVVAADILEPWPMTADAVVLARVLHDWDDAQALRILRRAWSALKPGGFVFIVELHVSEDGAFGGLCDLHLLMVTGGGERTSAEYTALLERAGFQSVERRALGALPELIVGTRP